MIPLAAIFVSIIIFVFSQKREEEKLAKQFAIETYTNTTTAIETLMNKEATDPEYKSIRDELTYKYYPRTKFIGTKGKPANSACVKKIPYK